MTEENLKVRLLVEEYGLLEKSMETLKLSISKCRPIIAKDEYSFEEMESFDSLTSKFGRTSDIYTQKVLRTIWSLLHEPFLPFIDFLNQTEKLGIIKSADQLLEARDLRNQITHEYIPEAITSLIPEVIECCSRLLENIDSTKQFMQKRNWL